VRCFKESRVHQARWGFFKCFLGGKGGRGLASRDRDVTEANALS
jgi:hypothetical protein